MPKPTREQLKKINKFSQVELKEDQVFVFQSLSADTLPIRRRSWLGEYHIEMTERMLNKLKKDYQNGVGLLASHNSNRLPFGRTFDAEVKLDEVGGEKVSTLYIDHYIVKYVEDEDGNKVPLRTEINGMTTQDIAHHVEVGHTFDTSIGFSMDEIKCSICKNDLRDWTKCNHVPAMYYDVQVGDRTEKQRCNIIADFGEGIENSLVYAGAVNRALIQNGKESNGTENFSVSSQDFEGSVKFGDTSLYNVDELKNLPLDAQVLCFLSKGNMEVFTTTGERRDYKKYLENKEREEMSDANKTVTTEAVQLQATELSPVVSQTLYDEVVGKLAKAEEALSKTAGELLSLKDELKEKDAQIEALSVKAQLADQFQAELLEDVVKAGVAARGNAFNVERYRKYAETLSVAELKEELAAFKGEFPATVEAARVTAQETETERQDEGAEKLSKQEIRQEAGRLAMIEFQKNGGDLVALTEQKYTELLEKHGY